MRLTYKALDQNEKETGTIWYASTEGNSIFPKSTKEEEVLKKLSDYEDTGLTPEEVQDLIQLKNALSAAVEQGKYHIRKYERELQDYEYMKNNLSWFCEFMLDMDEDELEELIKAKREDRLIILPVSPEHEENDFCKRKIHIFCDGGLFAPHCAGTISELEYWYYEYPMIYQDFGGEHDFILDPDDYNVTWFTNKERCEEYLKKKYNKTSRGE